jgi:hypothetical protein
LLGVEEKPAVEGSSRCGKPVLVDLGAEKVHSSSIFHFREETPAVEPPPVVEGWVRWKSLLGPVEVGILEGSGGLFFIFWIQKVFAVLVNRLIKNSNYFVVENIWEVWYFELLKIR